MLSNITWYVVIGCLLGVLVLLQSPQKSSHHHRLGTTTTS